MDAGPGAGAARETLPWQLRLARLGEGLFFPVGALLMAAIPFDQPLALAAVGAQLAVAVFAFRGLKRRSRLAWLAALALAAFLLVRIVLYMGPLAREALGAGGSAFTLPLALAGWVFATQLLVLVGCLALLGTSRTVLR
ncbi:MAG TPA: hypothetical protein VEW03_15445 [Longimicrobiaceae bacterium]|nr:hypothetical protein [Longimicrobiaceae bacterium]